MNTKRMCSINKIRDIQPEQIEVNEQYDVVKVIGSGDYGRVMLAVHKGTTKELALKAVPKLSTTLKEFQIEFHYSYFLSPHINILDTYDVAFETLDHYFFAQEVAPHGDMWHVIEKQNGMDEQDVKPIVRQVTSALEFMHSKDLVHRDFRAENILIFQPDYSKVKLTDFGLTRVAGTLVKKRTRSLPTCPPEIWEAVHLEGYNVEIGSDVWQMGMLLIAALTGKFPWEKADITDSNFTEFVQWQKRKSTRTPKELKRFAPRFLRLLRRLMDPKPSKRYPIEEVYKYLRDRWIVSRNPTNRTLDTAEKSVVKQDELGDLLSTFNLETRDANNSKHH